MAPPPMFAKFMLRKSVDRLNSEVCVDISRRFSIFFFLFFQFRVINQFRSRLEEIKEKRQEEASEHRRNSRAHILDE